jgi:hypothetical protein
LYLSSCRLSSRALNVVLSEQLVILTPKAEDNLERRVLQPCLHGYNRAEEVGACPIQLSLVFEKYSDLELSCLDVAFENIFSAPSISRIHL